MNSDSAYALLNYGHIFLEWRCGAAINFIDLKSLTGFLDEIAQQEYL